ncbi:MAG TPA: ABC-2 transporter permease [Thermoanaerobaculia bacterium]|jgi:ABC-type transport system involved in multi-copper enzyme maturation permease subunit|nr:ABC-2 transporter permease [Thermoanaerobaculia bacterium]
MNWPIVKRLVWKDWYLLRWPIVGCLAGGAFSVAMIGMGSNASFYFGSILFITVMMIAAILLPMGTVIQERKDQTLPFIMTLPVSPDEYTLSKIIGNLTIFAVPWLLLSGGVMVVLANGGPKMRAVIPFSAALLGEMFASFVLLLTVAIVTESQAWTVSAMVAGNLFLQGFMYYVARIPSMARGLNGNGVTWGPAAITLLIAEALAVAAMVSVTFFLQRRKRDFL